MDYFQNGNIKYFYYKKKTSGLFQQGNVRFLPKVHSNSKEVRMKKWYGKIKKKKKGLKM